MCTHNICFRAETKKESIPLYTQVSQYKVGYKGYKSYGQVILMNFFTSLFLSTGYQHGEAFDDKEYKTTIYGVIVGCSLAAVFLVLFGITVLYYRYHFDKGGKSRSAKSGIPEGKPLPMGRVMRKPVFGISDQVRHKPGCAITENG